MLTMDDFSLNDDQESTTPIRQLRGHAQAVVTRFKTWLTRYDQDKGLEEELELRLDKVVSADLEWKDIHRKIITEESGVDKLAENQKFIEFEELVIEVISKARKLLRQARGDNASLSSIPSNHSRANDDLNKPNTVIISNNMNLGALEIEPFNGSRSDWFRFKEMFTTIIALQQPPASNMEKLHRLKQTCTGCASNLIKNLTYSEGSFDIAWNLLINRFEDVFTLASIYTRDILELDPISEVDGDKLSALVDSITGSLAALKAVKVDTKSWDLLIISIVSSKVDEVTRQQWQSQLQANQMPTWAQMLTFLERRVRVLVTASALKQSKSTQPSPAAPSQSYTKRFDHKPKPSKAMVANATEACVKCSQQHPLYLCQPFKEMPVNLKYELLKRSNTCFNCLHQGHGSQSCPSTSRCKTCSRCHHTLLHHTSNPPGFSGHVKQPSKGSQVLLATAMVLVQDGAGEKHLCRALIDIGSMEHFMSEDLAQRLRLKRKPVNRPIEGVNSTTSRINSTVTSVIQSPLEPYSRKLLFLIVPKVTGNLPSCSIDISTWRMPTGIQLADPKFNKPQRVDLLLGGGVFTELLKDGRIKLAKGQPYLLNTKLGWVVSGKYTANQRSSPRRSAALATFCGMISNQQLSEQVEQLFKIDEITKAPVQPEAQLCEDLFQATTTRGTDGRYVVKLPLKENINDLGNSKRIAATQLQRLLTRLESNQQLRELYHQFMREYEQLGHMEEIQEDVDSQQCYYMPHHGVLKLSSSTTKLRVVFNGSQATSSGYSINDLTFNGGLVQQELFDIALCFRYFLYTFGSDIEKMYRQTWIHPEHQDFQRILWQRPEEGAPRSFRLKTITYGTKSAPHLATRALKQLAMDLAEDYPLAARAILYNTYVDDVLGGADSIDEALQQMRELQQMLASAQMNLHKWSASDSRLLADIPKEHQEPLRPTSGGAGRESLKALGLNWCPPKDELFFEHRAHTPKQRSKRDALSLLASTFDPMGLISPFLVKMKIFMQQAWKLNLGWDDPLPSNLLNEWNALVADSLKMNEIRIPRGVKVSTSPIAVIGFSDASKLAMCACIYIRSESDDGSVVTRLLCSKTRVAPLGAATIPRLELNAAHMLAELMHRVVTTLNINPSSCTLWTDSMIVLCWLRKNVDQLKTFVHNRVLSICKLTEGMVWNHVRTNENPADLGSRGACIDELKGSDLWWHGPSFIRTPLREWPQSLLSVDNTHIEQQVEMEMKAMVAVVVHQPTETFMERYSKFGKLLRITAYMLRFINRTRYQRAQPVYDIISVDELNDATTMVLKLEQATRFSDEIRKLSHQNPVGNQSSLKSLNPFLDDKGVIRVGGRLDNSTQSYDAKHPVVLPAKSHLATLIVRGMHQECLHIGQQGLLAIVHQQYWPINGRLLVRKIVRSCFECFKVTPRINHQMMGQLPSQRVVESFPFQKTGVDFGGPFYIKQGGVRSTKLIKAYLCLFVCQATKAVHLEIVSDLSTNAFLDALHRFIARRGLCSDIFSDNGTNFVGANKELKELHAQFSSEDHNKTVATDCASKKIRWHFNPAGSPHFGGLFEAGIKQAKVHFRRIAGTANLTFEELSTLMTQVEAVLNSRPLTAMTQDPSDLAVLTPGHLLIGRELLAIAEPSLDHLKQSTLSRHQRLDQLRRHFWDRWNIEYVTQLQQRTKWQQGSTTISIGQLALIRDENLPPLQWRLGRIVETHPGQDGVTRAVTLRTNSGLFSRATHKICILPTNEPDEPDETDDLPSQSCNQVAAGENEET